MNEESVDIGPVKRVLVGVPNHALTANISCWRNTVNFVRHSATLSEI
jgi:hypothetical protein